MTQDIRLALRSLRRQPAFTLTVLATLALGIGATTAIFSVVNAILLRPLPFPDPQALTTVWLNNPRQGFDEDITSWPNFADWRAQSRTFQYLVGVRPGQVNLTGSGVPEELPAARVSENFFAMLGVPPLLGRGFESLEHEAERHRVVVLGHNLWVRSFGSDPHALGKMLRLDGESYTVVGVMPPGVDYPEGANLWLPLTFTADSAALKEARSALWLPVVGRLAPGVNLDQAQAEMDAIARRLEQTYPENEDMGIKLEPLHVTLTGDVRPGLLVLLGAVGFVLLISSVNVANLLLGQGAAHRHEMALRAALGAGRTRLLRQVLTQCVALGLLGAAAGLALAVLGVHLLERIAPAQVAGAATAVADLRVIGFTAAVSLLSSFAFGAFPALEAARAAPGAALGSERVVAPTGRLLQPGLVVGQFAIALVLLAGAGLLLRSFAALRTVDPGFDADRVLTASVSLSELRYPDRPAVAAFFDRLLVTLRSRPEVASADAISQFLLGVLPQSAPVTVEGRVDPPDQDRMFPVAYDAVTPGFFATLRIPLERGRNFAEQDAAGTEPVAVVNRAFAQRFVQHRDPLGARFVFGDQEGQEPRWITVVGVAGDARRSGLDQEARPSVYLPLHQYAPNRMTIVIRTHRDPAGFIEGVRRTVAELDPEQPVSELRTLEQAVGTTMAGRRFLLRVLGLFAAMATLLAAVGIYGVMAYRAGQRTREFGIRIALGAKRWAIFALVLREAMLQTLLGVTLGLTGALLLSRLLVHQLYGVAPTDLVTLGATSMLLALVALLAGYLPARRAARVDPARTLRAE